MILTIIPCPSVREQLALLEARKLQYQRAALQAKRSQDLEQAKAHLRVAKCLEAQITQVRRVGRPVDFSKVSFTCLSSWTSQAEEALAGLTGRAVNEAAAWRGCDADRMQTERACCLCCSTPLPEERPGKATRAACGQR